MYDSISASTDLFLRVDFAFGKSSGQVDAENPALARSGVAGGAERVVNNVPRVFDRDHVRPAGIGSTLLR